MMPLQNILQGNYNTGNSPYQIKLPIELGIKIADNDPVRLLDSFVDAMDLTELCNSYGRRVKKTADPVKLFKIVVFGIMKKIYSARGLQEACRKNIDFMYLLDGSPVPDHATFARFVSDHFSKCSEETMTKMTLLLKELGEISGETIFIDGTKIEAYANKYTFVWKKAVTKNMEKMGEKISVFVKNCIKDFDIQSISGSNLSLRFLKKMRKKLYAVKHEREIKFFHGIGKKKSKLQKAVEELEAYELYPFRQAVAAGVDGIMVAHILYPAIDPDHIATQSEVIITDLLRTGMGFEGVVMSDDFRMNGLRSKASLEQAAVQFILAGGDLILCGANHSYQRSILKGLTDAVANGTISQERLNESVVRLLTAKMKVTAWEPEP